MPRERHRRAASAAPPATRHRLTSRTKPPYKVVLEQVTQQKKKLIVVGSSRPQPPPGYTFIPAGDPQITTRCKHLARLDGAKVYVVSTTRHKHGLSNQVHRIGYHFPSSVVARACTSLGINLSHDGHVLHQHHEWSAAGAPKHRHGKKQKLLSKSLAKASLSQATVDTLAREAIKDLFPNIPPKDLHEIVIHAFELGTTRVGNAEELSLPRRVQLAVVAHIRHNYTDYDKLLKQVPYQVARAMVEQPSLDRLAQWRGDEDEEPNAMEEILREVIVIPDDDDEKDDRESVHRPSSRQNSIEILSSRAIADGLETHPIDYAAERSLAIGIESPDSDDVQEVTFLGHGQYAFDTPNEGRDARNGAHRHRAWEQARHRLKQPDGQVAALSTTNTRRLAELPRSQRTDFASSDPHISSLPGTYQDHQPGSHNITYLREIPSHMPNTLNGTGHLYAIDPNLNPRDSYGGVHQQFSSPNTIGSIKAHSLSKPINRDSRYPDNIYHEELARTRHSFVDNLESNHVSSAYMSPRLRDTSRFQQLEIQSPLRDSSRFESVAQSIETPINDTFRSFHPARISQPLPSSHDYRVRNVDLEDWNRSSVTQQNFDGLQQMTKRRRLEGVDPRLLRQHNDSSDLQRSLLIPIGDTKRLDSFVQQPTVFRRIEEREPAVMHTRSQGGRPAQTGIHLVERDGPASRFFPTELDHGVSYSVDSPRQRQVLVSTQKPHTRMFSTTEFEVPSEKPASEHTNHGWVYSFPYSSSAPHVSLPNEVPYASYVVASGSEHRAAPRAVVTGHTQKFNQTTQLGGNLTSEEMMPRVRPDNRIEQPTGPAFNGPTSVHRARRPLPLEMSFEELRPAWKEMPMNEVNYTSYRYTNMDTASPTAVTGEPKNPPELRTIYTRDEPSGAKPVNDIQSQERHRRLDRSIQHENRVMKLPKRYEGKHSSVREMPLRIVREVYEPAMRLSTYDRTPQKVLDPRTGREIIVLE